MNFGHWLSGAVHSVEHIHVNLGGISHTLGPLASAASSVLPPDAAAGLNQGMASFNQVSNTLQQGPGALLGQVNQLRSQLPPNLAGGFDMAAAMARAHAAGIFPPPNLPPAAQAAYLATHGMVGGSPPQNQAVMTALAANPVTASGAALAVAHIEAAKEPWWHFAWLKHLFGFGKKAGVHGDGSGEAEALLNFMRHNGVPAYPAQEVYDFQVSAGLQPQDGRYTPQVQVALAMSPVITGTVPNPVLK